MQNLVHLSHSFSVQLFEKTYLKGSFMYKKQHLVAISIRLCSFQFKKANAIFPLRGSLTSPTKHCKV